MNPIMSTLGSRLARFLNRPNPRYQPLAITDPQAVAAAIAPGDVLLVEGNTRFSTAIKYLSQSTWSHAALYVGNAVDPRDAARRELVEADVVHGVTTVPLEKYDGMHTRICRPVGLSAEDRARVIGYALERVGQRYDLKNIFDLVRYLLPQPPVPVRWRRRMLALGSGDPSRAICSTLIAQALQSVRYPILPTVTRKVASAEDCYDEIMQIRHHSLFVPRDFDISPYFEIVKPTLARGFDYRQITWDGEGENTPSN
ncbi:MAG: lipo-like protein [Rhodocyclaceae bacterium]|jgi:hypothetical protein|nr:lipo-like protein [Rhodocyclaceae bacterium]